MKRHQYGFSIVELIVIIVVVGILATIAILSYNGIQNNAYDTAVQSDLENAAGQLEAYRTQQSNVAQQFPNTTTQLGTLQIKANKGSYSTSTLNFTYCNDTTRQQFALVGMSKSGNIYVMSEDGFRSHTLTAANFTTSLCTTLGLTLRSNGFTGSSWQAWVKG
jgi:type II secretory pathway pseudopilin PulG